MLGIGFTLEEILDSVPEKDKLDVPYLKGNIDKTIADLVYDKKRTRTAYNYYVGRRDDYELQHLTDNYGVGVPTEIPHMRMIGRRINSLIGKQLQNNLDYFITCNNEIALEEKSNEKKNKIMGDINSQVNKYAGKKEEVIDDLFLNTLKEKYGLGWQTDFEIAVQEYIGYFIDKNELKNEFKELGKDMFISGEMYNRVFVRELGKDPEHWKVDPRDFFYETNPNSIWIEDCKRVVYRRFMSPTQILNELGHLIEPDEYDKVARAIISYYNERYQREVMFVENKYGENIATADIPRYEADLIEVFHVEWVATNPFKGDTDVVDLVESKAKNIKSKNRYRTDRYEGYRIEVGGGIYIGMGRCKNIERTIQDPYACKLTYNGMVYNRNYDEAYSMVLATKDVSDMYDITYFHLNNLLAAARPGGTYTVLEHIPKEFGDTPEERLLKNAGYEKTLSQKLISISQEGMEDGYEFNNYGQYGSNIDGSLVSAFTQYIELLEQQADRMLGLNQRMYGEVEERDGKAVTLSAIQQGEVITKDLFHLISLFIKKTLQKTIDSARLSYKEKPFMGSYVTNKNHVMFSLDSQKLSMTDLKVFIVDDAEEAEIKTKVDSLVNIAIQNQQADLKTAFDMLVSKSTSQKKKVLEKIGEKGMANLQQQLEELNKQLQEVTKQNEKLQKEVQGSKQAEMQIKQEELKLKQQELAHKMKTDQKGIEIEKDKVSNKEETDKMKIQAELAQMYDINKNNDKINWNR
jgi:hypothetical protein